MIISDNSSTIERLDQKMDARNAVVLMYRIIDDKTDKFIVMSCLHLNYTQEETAMMLGISQEAVSKRLKKAREFLKLKQSEVIL